MVSSSGHQASCTEMRFMSTVVLRSFTLQLALQFCFIVRSDRQIFLRLVPECLRLRNDGMARRWRLWLWRKCQPVGISKVVGNYISGRLTLVLGRRMVFLFIGRFVVWVGRWSLFSTWVDVGHGVGCFDKQKTRVSGSQNSRGSVLGQRSPFVCV
jgi:hypothetical protein